MCAVRSVWGLRSGPWAWGRGAVCGGMVVALGGCGPPARPPSVVVVALDGVRPDRTGLVRADRPTPALSALAAAPGAVWFSDARAAASWSAAPLL